MNIFGISIMFYAAGGLGIMFILTLIALILAIKANSKMKKLLRDNRGADITNAIINYYDECKKIQENYRDAENRVKILESQMKMCVKKVGTTRYNAFGENHANLSFTAAILDDSDSGFVINGVYARGNTTTYLKPINSGKSLFALSDEEQKAIDNAKENYNNKVKN